MAARTRKITLSDTWRERIRASMIMDRLIKHFNGDLELTRDQIKSAEIILKKIEPDLKAIDLRADVKEDVKITFGWSNDPHSN